MSSRKADQNQWLSEAVVALGEAERLTGLLALSHTHHDLTLAALQAEIMELRHEIERLQRIRSGDGWRDFHPDWMRLSAMEPGSLGSPEASRRPRRNLAGMAGKQAQPNRQWRRSAVQERRLAVAERLAIGTHTFRRAPSSTAMPPPCPLGRRAEPRIGSARPSATIQNFKDEPTAS